jgi:mono/diheme cytochrome c family protein
MKILNQTTALALLSLGLLLALAGCGGGSSDSNEKTGNESVATATNTSLSGVAASGAAVVGLVLLKDSSPSPVQLSTSSASDGSFAFNTTGLKPPFLLKTAATTPALYSLADANGRTNLTPLTTLALAQAAGSTDLAKLFSDPAAGAVIAAAGRMSASVSTLQTLLAPLLGQFAVTTNLLSGAFSANHTGLDAVLDAITVSVSAGTVTITNKASGGLLLSAPLGGLATASLNSANLPGAAASQASAAGSALYTTQCAGCHGTLGASALRGTATVRSIQAAVAANLGGMGSLSSLPLADLQAIADALTNAPTQPTTPGAAAPDGASLYAGQCAACHGALASSTKLGLSLVRLQNAISGNVGGMAALAKLAAAELQAITSALNATTPPGTAPVVSADGAALYASYCASCHGTLANSGKSGATLARLQNAISANSGGMGTLTTLSVTQVQAIITALTPSTPTPTPTPIPAPTADGTALYASNCASCHGALAASTKGGASAAGIQSAISANLGGMGSLSTLNSVQVAAIGKALAAIAPAPVAAATCGSCHAIPPASGRHAKHLREAVSCANCHGTGYSTSSVVAALHNNGVKNLASNTAWNATTRSCSNSCHGKESW